MCLGVVGRVIEVRGLVALVDFWGVRKKVRLDTVDEPVGPGDYILNHVGFAIKRIPDAEVAATLAFYEELINAEDLLARELQADLRAAQGG
jgi:hydrogenase expression/formation protein HypC